jgi:peroxiredoxin
MNNQAKVGMVVAGALLGCCVLVMACGGVALVGVGVWSFDRMGPWETGPNVEGNAPDLSATPKPAKPAPDFELTTLSGATARLSDLRGQPVVLNFYTTWCPDCRDEAPQVQRWHTAYPDLALWVVDLEEDAPTVRDFAREFAWTLDVVLDHDGDVAQAYRVYAIPTWFFIDAKGLIQAKYIEALTPEHWAEGLGKIGVDVTK